MPTYSYYCDSCSVTTEEFFPMKSFPDAISCGCGGIAKKSMDAALFILGDGAWARNRYAGDSNRPGGEDS